MSNPEPQNQNQILSTTTLSPSQFYHTLTTTAIAQILRSLGFKSAKPSALRTLTRLATLFLQSLAATAAAHATVSCGRTQCNLFDVIHAIEYHSLPLGFSGASAINQPFLNSKTLQDLSYFIIAFNEFPFRRRVRSSASSSSSSSSSSVIFGGKLGISLKGENDRRGPEVPRWLPPFPEVRDDDYGGVEGNDSKEPLWEKKKAECGGPPREKKVKKRGKELVVQGRRERVKFRLGRRSRHANLCDLDDLKLRNGVCRGGKRVCLIKKVDNISRFFQDDDVDDEKNL